MNKKRVISEYLIKDLRQEQWFSKDDAIAMAEEGCLCAIVVHAKKGAYLRPKHGFESFKEMLYALLYPVQDPAEHALAFV